MQPWIVHWNVPFEEVVDEPGVSKLGVLSELSDGWVSVDEVSESPDSD